MKVVVDIEADGLRPKHIWCVCCYEVDTKEWKVFREGMEQECKEYLENSDLIIGHNIIDFDLPVLRNLWNVQIGVEKVYDTLVMSRLACPKRARGHSLKEWGISLGNYKDHFEDWTHWSEEMEEYCKQDVRVTYDVYRRVQQELAGFSPLSIALEHRSQWLLSIQHYNGFDFDMDAAIELKNKMMSEYFILIKKLQEAFPPRKVLKCTYQARYKKDGTLTAKSQEIISRDNVEPTEEKGIYNVYEYKEFLIDSPAEIVERLKPYWKPVVWNKPSQKNPDRPVTPKICDENLETVGPDAPEAIKDLVRCKILKSRSTLVQSFIDACWEDGRVHGDVISVGASSNRMAHRNPNTGNIPSDGSLYGSDCRALYKAPEGKLIVGCDASGIQLRALAHYVGDEELIHQILHGDIHVHLAKIYGLMPNEEYDESNPVHKKARKTGKTITYSILMGAGEAKVGSLAGGDKKLGKKIIQKIEAGIKGWSRFKKTIEARAKIGYFKALDGRLITLPNAHKGMSFYLQSFEQAVVKWVMWKAYQRLTKAGYDFKQIAVVHDEIQYEVREDQAEEVGKIVQQCFRDATEYFHSKCPLEGEYKIGKSWKDSH